ncbi:Pentatricopeptide repeat-containing protein [Acorus calamus]|uniref:Pentatricopeptide repeat-containing protein n=1 Tax=Acorus calamus TaxID=4465 RepID=A0AAV9DAI8_ACOCL|nr:Pentatricopeptide repeat-containing protein [Acorus calamus]
MVNIMEAHTVPKLLKSCATARSLSLGQSIHNRVIVSGLSSDPYISSSLLHFYSKCDQTQLARKVFDAMPTKNVVAWTSIIAAYSRSNDPGTAFSMYDHMRARGVLPNSVTLLSLLLPSPPRFFNVQCVHACAVRTGFAGSLVVVNSMLNAYAKSGNVDVSRALFDEMRCFRDVVSWNCVVSGYAWCGNLKESMSLVKQMMGLGGESVRPDAQTFTSLLSGVSDHGELKLGKSVHAQILVSGLRPDRHVETALLGMYLNCGSTDDALLVFNGMLDADAVSWTAMISGLVQNFRANDALIVFRKLLASGALVNWIETWMLPNPTADVLGILLEACKMHGYERLHREIARQVTELKLKTAENYVQLAQSYAALNLWEGVGETWAMMRTLGLKKTPGWSFIELHGTITPFFVNDSSHPSYEEIVSVLKLLEWEYR